MTDFRELQARWSAEAAESDLGLWWIADDVRATLPRDTSEKEVSRHTMDALRPLLESGGLRAVTLKEWGAYDEWRGTVDEILERIRLEWSRLQSKPNIGNVVWFIGNR